MTPERKPEMKCDKCDADEVVFPLCDLMLCLRCNDKEIMEMNKHVTIHECVCACGYRAHCPDDYAHHKQQCGFMDAAICLRCGQLMKYHDSGEYYNDKTGKMDGCRVVFPAGVPTPVAEVISVDWVLKQLDRLEADFTKRVENSAHPDVSTERMFGAISFMQTFRESIKARIGGLK